MAENHVVHPGECISSLAQDNGLLWQTIWDHPNNAALKELRHDPNILMPGDTVFIPDLRVREEEHVTDQRHIFTRQNALATLRLRFVLPRLTGDPAPQSPPQNGARHVVDGDPENRVSAEEDVPQANVPYSLAIDGVETSGATDSSGNIQASIPPNAKQGTITLSPGTADEMKIPLQIGYLDPITEATGLKQRLANLGLDCGDRTNQMNDALAEAICVFQEKYSLPVTGEADQTTRDKLASVHGS
jgi:hypothetical protein